MNPIEVRDVSQTFTRNKEQKTVLDGVSFTIEPGEFVALCGDNGSGKTTLINIILGLRNPQRGEVKLLGHAPQTPESKTRLGVMLQKVAVPKNLKVKERVDLLRSYYPDSLSTEEILNTVNLEGKHQDWASKLSGGEEQRLYFAIALAGNPDLLILDEPTRNLDTEGCATFWQQIKACREKGITILMVTNNKSDWEELSHLATRSITLADGKIAEEKRLNEVMEKKKKPELRATVENQRVWLPFGKQV